MYEDKTGLLEALRPYPFVESGSKKVYAKILDYNREAIAEEDISDDSYTQLQVTILNQEMLEFDHEILGRSEAESEGRALFRPYFYEYFFEMKTKELASASQFEWNDKIGTWYVAEFTDSVKNDDGLMLDGTAFFSVGPFKMQKRTLVITDTQAPENINSMIETTYNVESALFSKGDTTHIKVERELGKLTDDALDYQVKIYNVCQGNCNYIYCKHENQDNRILFDIGHSCFSRSADWRAREAGVKFCIKNMKPHLVILSHWDLDHIIGAGFASQSMFGVDWIAPDLNELGSSVSVGAQRLARHLHCNGKLHLPHRSFAGTSIYKGKTGFELWHGIGKRDSLSKANNYGLLVVMNRSKSVLLAGDCEYSMLPHGIDIENKEYEYLVVPHHGSKIKLPSGCAAKGLSKSNYAIVSVGENTYKHPADQHLNFLRAQGYEVKRTDKIGNGKVKYYILLKSTDQIDLEIRYAK